jgi:ubiquitin-protein ligase
MKAVMKEVRKDLPKSLELSSSASMFVRVDEDRPQFLRALLTGVSGSAYDSGLFCFDIYCPDSYPNTNCLVTHTSKHATMVKGNNGPGGFSPNLHQSSGKVCLSLLGTWDGPGWQSGVSNVYQVLASIQFLILGVSHPYYNEPGQGFWEGSAPKTDHSEKVIEYTERVWFGTARYAILEAHFRAKWRLILKLVESWWEKGTAGLKEKLSPVLAELRQRFTETYLTVEEAKRDVEAAQITIRFIEEKMRYLEVKVNLAGGGRLAKKRVPKAYRRLRLGPNLLAMARKELREKQNALAAVEERNHADASR